MIVSHRFTKNIVVDLNYTEPFCIFLNRFVHLFFHLLDKLDKNIDQEIPQIFLVP